LYNHPIVMKFLLALILALNLSAAGREVAITIDDLPRGGGDPGPFDLASVRAMTEKLLAPFREQKIPVIGFVNAGRHNLGPQGLRQILDLWLDAGADLGNHSYSHPNINNAGLAKYTADILKGEPAVRDALAARGKKMVFYRHPFLFTGSTPQTKAALATFLAQHHYRVAPVTFDNNDWEFASLYNQTAYQDRVARDYVPYMESVVAFFEQRSIEVVGREFPQILLIHASRMNADLMPELLAMFRRRGYTFVSLEHALADKAYSLPDTVPMKGGNSWLHRWAASKGMPAKDEPDSPRWVKDARSQDPYRVAPNNYHLAFENQWVRATRVTFNPHETLPVHHHPPTPTTLYVYVTDGGAIRFNHVTGDHVAGMSIVRNPVKAGQIRFAHGAPETHTVEYLGLEPCEYARIELRTEPLERPVRDVRLPPHGSFENAQVRILSITCEAAKPCPPSDHPTDPAVVVILSGPHRGEIQWSPPPAVGPLEMVRLELKTKPDSH
jgi:peptidoglycan-N-acetylglucosamine deacetylase